MPAGFHTGCLVGAVFAASMTGISFWVHKRFNDNCKSPVNPSGLVVHDNSTVPAKVAKIGMIVSAVVTALLVFVLFRQYKGVGGHQGGCQLTLVYAGLVLGTSLWVRKTVKDFCPDPASGPKFDNLLIGYSVAAGLVGAVVVYDMYRHASVKPYLRGQGSRPLKD